MIEPVQRDDPAADGLVASREERRREPRCEFLLLAAYRRRQRRVHDGCDAQGVQLVQRVPLLVGVSPEAQVLLGGEPAAVDQKSAELGFNDAGVAQRREQAVAPFGPVADQAVANRAVRLLVADDEQSGLSTEGVGIPLDFGVDQEVGEVRDDAADLVGMVVHGWWLLLWKRAQERDLPSPGKQVPRRG